MCSRTGFRDVLVALLARAGTLTIVTNTYQVTAEPVAHDRSAGSCTAWCSCGARQKVTGTASNVAGRSYSWATEHLRDEHAVKYARQRKQGRLPTWYGVDERVLTEDEQRRYRELVLAEGSAHASWQEDVRLKSMRLGAGTFILLGFGGLFGLMTADLADERTPAMDSLQTASAVGIVLAFVFVMPWWIWAVIRERRDSRARRVDDYLRTIAFQDRPRWTAPPPSDDDDDAGLVPRWQSPKRWHPPTWGSGARSGGKSQSRMTGRNGRAR